VLAAVVEGTTPCLSTTAAAPIHRCHDSMPARRGAARGSEQSCTTRHNLALHHAAGHHLACRRPPPRVAPPLVSLDACAHACRRWLEKRRRAGSAVVRPQFPLMQPSSTTSRCGGVAGHKQSGSMDGPTSPKRRCPPRGSPSSRCLTPSEQRGEKRG
jgi:hypothetical protein